MGASSFCYNHMGLEEVVVEAKGDKGTVAGREEDVGAVDHPFAGICRIGECVVDKVLVLVEVLVFVLKTKTEQVDVQVKGTAVAHPVVDARDNIEGNVGVGVFLAFNIGVDSLVVYGTLVILGLESVEFGVETQRYTQLRLGEDGKVILLNQVVA